MERRVESKFHDPCKMVAGTVFVHLVAALLKIF